MLGVVLAALLLMPAAAAAEPPSKLLSGPRVGGVVVAGGQVYSGEYRGDRYVVRRGGAVVHTQDARGFADQETSVTRRFGFGASATHLAVLREVESDTPVTSSSEEDMSFGPFGSLAPLWQCDFPDGGGPGPGGVPLDVDGAAVLYLKPGCGDPERLRVTENGVTKDVAVPEGESVLGYAMAGDVIAFVSSSNSSLAPAHLTVVRRSTGERLYGVGAVPGGTLDVQADGTVALVPSTGCPAELRWYSAAEPREHRVAGTAACSGPALAGGRALYIDRRGAARVADLRTGAQQVVAGGVFVRELATDGTTAGFVADDCAGFAVYRAPLAANDPLTPPARCPVRLAGRRTVRAQRGVVRLTVSCPRGCVGSAALVRRRSQNVFQGFAGVAPLSNSGGRARLRFRLTREAPGGRRLRAILRVDTTGPTGRESTAYFPLTILR